MSLFVIDTNIKNNKLSFSNIFQGPKSRESSPMLEMKNDVKGIHQ